MKKYIALLLVIFGLSACSNADDYCDRGYIPTYQLDPRNGFDPYNFKVRSLNGDSFTVIRSENEFRRLVDGSIYYQNVIDFNQHDLIIGQLYLRDFRSIPNIIVMFKEFCDYNMGGQLDVNFYVTPGNYRDYVTYHAIVPKLYNPNIEVITTVNY